MKKIIAILLSVSLLFAVGCSKNEVSNDIGSSGKSQYVIALNPSVMLEDGKILSARNNAATAISADIKSGTCGHLYSDTNWQWIYRSAEGEWNNRIPRSVAQWSDANGAIPKNAPFAYQTDDSGISSIAVYDRSKTSIDGVNDGEIPKSGIILSFSDGNQEALCYTADTDCLINFLDRDGGNIALVSAVAGAKTAVVGQKDEKNAIILRIYKNNRIYWQEILNSEKTAVAFPEFTCLQMEKGDTVIFAAEVVDDAGDIVCGMCDLPAYSKTVVKRTEHKETVEHLTTEPEITEISFVDMSNSTFTIVYPEKASEEVKLLVENVRRKMEETLQVMVSAVSDKDDDMIPGGYLILVGETRFEESEVTVADVKSGRDKNAGDYIIRLIGKKLCIASATEIGLELALDFFLTNYCKDDNSTVPAKLNYISSTFNQIEKLTVEATDVSAFNIVISRFSSRIDVQSAKYLQKQIASVSGIYLNIVRDNEAPKNNEILIGNTNRTSSSYSVITETPGNSYNVSVNKGIVSITGDNSAAVSAGTIEFANKLISKKELKSGFTVSGEYDGGYSIADGYKLVWSDEFESLQTSIYNIDNNTSGNPSVYGGTAFSKASSTFVKDGALVQRIERVGNDVYESNITTQSKMLYKYGYIEFRIKLSVNAGSWGAFWLCSSLGNDGLGEIDIFENFGNLYSVKPNMHKWGPGDGEHENLFQKSDTILNYIPGTTSTEPYGYNYHTIGMEWEKGLIVFYVDGVKTQSYAYGNDYTCFDKPMYMILSHWGGRNTSDFANCILSPDFSYSDIKYDWIRIYQKEDQASFVYVKK